MRHMFINGSIDGTPDIDLEDGTISGLTISSDNYKAVGLGDNPCCKRVVGGRIEIRKEGKVYQLMGKTTIQPANIERTSGPTQSGRQWTTIKPKLATASIQLANFCDAEYTEFFDKDCDVTVVIEELDR